MRAFSRFAALVFGTVLASAACGDDDDGPPPVDLGNGVVAVQVSLDPFVIRIRDANGNEVLRTLDGGDGKPYGTPAATRDDGADNVKGIPGWDGYSPEEAPWTHGGGGAIVSRTEAAASFLLHAGAGVIHVDITLEGSKVSIRTQADVPDASWNKTTLSFALRPDEHFFGLGERFASVDHRGLSLYSWPEEGALGKGEGTPRGDDNPFPNGPSMTYFPVPFFLSSAGYAVQLATTYRTETHFGSERPDAWRAAVNATALTTVVYVHDDPRASLDDFTRETGRPMVPATWTFGPVWRAGNDDRVGADFEWKALRDKKVPTTTLDDNVHFLPARSETGREDTLKQWTALAHSWGYKVVAYNNPHVALGNDRAKADADEGRARGYFALTPEGQVAETAFISGEPLTLATIDLTKPEAVAWFQSILKRSLDLGYDGWMHDFGEYVRRPWKFADGRDGAAVHNEFPVLSAKAAHDLAVAERGNDFLFYVRSGYTGTTQYVPAVWSGDPEATFDETQGIPAMLRGGLNLGMSGVALWGSDVTGFKCITEFPHDKEMFLRWAALGAASPFMLEENACANPLGSRTKWKLWNDDETIAVYGAMARLHTRLAPYFDVLAREAHATGIPIMRHPFLLHPHEPEAWATESSYYLGASLWASPVVARYATTKETWLPPGRWVDLTDLAAYDGGRRVTVAAPIDKLPLFLADGGIVPWLDASIETLAPSTEPSVVTPAAVRDRLDVTVALSVGKEARITLADGTVLVARRTTNRGAASGLADVPPASLPMCESLPEIAGCKSARSEGGVDRLGITTPLASSSHIVEDDVELDVTGAVPRRVRWDVMRLR